MPGSSAIVLRLLALCLVVLAACRSDRVPLAYTLEEGNTLSYRLIASAEAEWDIGGRGGGSYDATFDVSETVLSSDPSGSVIRVAMTPTSVTEEGLPSPGPEVRTFTLRIGPTGDVLEVIELEGLPSEAVEADDLAFIGTYRPPLPPAPVRLRDAWHSDQRLQVGQLFQHIDTRGELTAFRVGGDGERLAHLDYRGEGPLVWATSLSSGSAELNGSATITTDATFDIDKGYLERARSITRGTFEVQVVPTGRGLPIVGSLALSMDVSLRRVDEIGTPVPPISP